MRSTLFRILPDRSEVPLANSVGFTLGKQRVEAGGEAVATRSEVEPPALVRVPHTSLGTGVTQAQERTEIARRARGFPTDQQVYLSAPDAEEYLVEALTLPLGGSAGTAVVVADHPYDLDSLSFRPTTTLVDLRIDTGA